MNAGARAIITQLGLVPLPGEGGFFRATWRDAAGSAIYFLLTPEDFSALHRLPTVEIWHFYAGDAVEHVQLEPKPSAAGDAGCRVTRLGADVLAGDTPQLVVPAGVWQGARLAAATTTASSSAGWALVGCTLAPPWDERTFELAARAALLAQFPVHSGLVRALTR